MPGTFLVGVAILLMCPSVVLAEGLTKYAFTSYGTSTQDLRLLGILGARAVHASSRIACCMKCAKMSTCIGAAWKQDGSLCQVAENINTTSDAHLEGWTFYVKNEHIREYHCPTDEHVRKYYSLNILPHIRAHSLAP